jgi:hypothetical protein
VEVGFHEATYQFDPDGRFTLTFVLASNTGIAADVAGAGVARGTWRLEGKRLVMKNTDSTTHFTVVGEEEVAEAEVSGGQLVMLTTDRKGQTERLTLRRVEPSKPFAKGRIDKPQLVGTWQCGSATLLIAESGLAVVGMQQLAGVKGDWMQSGDQLDLLLSPPAARGDDPNRHERPHVGMPVPAGRVRLTIDHLDDTTLVLTGPLLNSSPRTLTFLRVTRTR